MGCNVSSGSPLQDQEIDDLLRVIGKVEEDEYTNDDGRDTFEDKSVGTRTVRCSMPTARRRSDTYSHCHPYSPLSPDMNDTPVAISPPKAPATAILAEKIAIRVCTHRGLVSAVRMSWESAVLTARW